MFLAVLLGLAAVRPEDSSCARGDAGAVALCTPQPEAPAQVPGGSMLADAESDEDADPASPTRGARAVVVGGSSAMTSPWRPDRPSPFDRADGLFRPS